jgi:DNA-binding transcriptional LysR family regulator
MQKGLNASAVSKQLTKLEDSLGTQLVYRTTRRVALTEAGRYFYERIINLERDWTDSLDETTSLGKELKGLLKIAAPQPLFSRFLMPILTDFKQKYPDITLELFSSPIQKLPYFDADISICRELANYNSATTVMAPFFSCQNALFASPKYLNNNKALDVLSQINEHCCIIYNDIKPVNQWQFESSSVALESTIVANNAEIMISAATNGLGIVYLPEALLQRELKHKEIIRVLPEQKSQVYRTCIYYPKADFLSLKVRAFIDFLKEHNVVVSLSH